MCGGSGVAADVGNERLGRGEGEMKEKRESVQDSWERRQYRREGRVSLV